MTTALTSKNRKGNDKTHGVRSLVRGLAILRYINREGEVRPADIARDTGIPRPTVYRMLETLEELGYVVFSATASQVRITRLAASLGDGYVITSELCQIAGPLFAEYANKVIWPLDLTVYNNAAMIIQETTHDRSPLSIDRGMTGYRLPVLRTSAGRAYLSFCPEEECQIILDHVRRLDAPEDRPFLEPSRLNSLLAETRQRGIAVRDGGEFRSRTASLAVPVRTDGTLLGCVSLIWIRSAMDTETALRDFGPTLQQIAERLGSSLPGSIA